ncbi:MAG: hypothetical protein ACREL4_02410, partial [Gemmatimonadales bacterium]
MTRRLALVLFCVTAPVRLSAQSFWRPEDRTIIGSFTHITAVAASYTVVYVTSLDAVVQWEPGTRTFGLPISADVPGGLARVTSGMVDPLDQSLWLSESNGWIHYEPTLRRWSEGFASGQVLQMALDRTDPSGTLFLRTARGWESAPRGALSTFPSAPPRQPIGPATVLDAIRANPQLDANRARILTTPGLGQARYTCAAQAPDGTGWWLGTDGGGVLFLRFAAAYPDRYSLGLPGNQVGAVAVAPGGVWVVTERGPTSIAGLSFVAQQLDTVDWRLGDPVFGQPFNAVRRLIGVGAMLWAATDEGAIGFPIPGGRAQRLGLADGMPDQRVFSEAAERGRVYFGTWAGVGELVDSAGRARVQHIAPAFADRALALATVGDTLWVGTLNGMFKWVPGTKDLIQATGWGSNVRLRKPVTALVWRGDTLVAFTEDEMLWRDPAGHGWTEGPVLSGVVGPIRAAVDDRNGLWVAGARGVGYARLGGPIERPLLLG